MYSFLALSMDDQPSALPSNWTTPLTITDTLFPTSEDARLALEETCYASKYGLSKGSCTRKKKNNQYDPTGEFRRFDFYCPYGGHEKTGVHRYQRRTPRASNSAKIGCPWHAKIVHQSDGTWKVSYVAADRGKGTPCNQHNHEPQGDLLNFDNYRRWWRKRHPGVVEGWVERLSGTGRMSASKIATVLRGELPLPAGALDGGHIPPPPPPTPPSNSNGPMIWEGFDVECNPPITWGDQPATTPAVSRSTERAAVPPLEPMPVLTSDVVTIQLKLMREKYNPQRATQLFVEELENTKQQYGLVYRVQRDGDQITRLFWAYQTSLQLWKKHHHLLMVDNTYKVRMPFSQTHSPSLALALSGVVHLLIV